jgi:hypothetical protein
MKTRCLNWLLTLGLAISSQAAVQTFTWSTGFANGGVIPDGDINGWQDTRTVSGFLGGDLITDVNVQLNISGGYNGDLYGYLVHSSGFAVLLNRVGRTSGNTYGYGDAGFTGVWLSDQGSVDIHNYGGNHGAAVGPGTWQPDARATDPATVLDTDARTAYLSGFNNLGPNGQWTLYFADLSPVYQSQITGWSLEITAVPEPVTMALGIFGVLFGAVQGVRYLRRKTVVG